MSLLEKSQYIAMLLRHKPEKGNLILDEEGYTDVESLLRAIDIDMKTLEKIVAEDNKGRYSFNEDKTRIRANQGHSVPYVHITFKKFIPDGSLYHGTALKYLDSILEEGLTPQQRLYVHLSQDYSVAFNVGMRHAKSPKNLVIFKIDWERMLEDGYEFYLSDNGVVLTKAVPPKYLIQIK